MKISVCVPTFERPGTTRLLIESFLAQDYDDRELVIADDSNTDAVERLVSGYADNRIVYQHNEEPVGFCGNLRACLARSSGEVAVILGDDDLLARTDALSTYAEAFAANPTVAFARVNLVQIDDNGEVTFAYVAADATTVFDKGQSALEHLLLSSVHIAGIAFRCVPDLFDHYPSEIMLFPQVRLAASILTKYPGMAIGAFLAAARMHEHQLGFAVMKNESPDKYSDRWVGGRVVSSGVQLPGRQGKHGNVEVMQVIATLRDESTVQPAVARAIERQYVKSYATNMVNEKITSGNRVMARNLDLLRKHSSVARKALWLAGLGAMLLVLPKRIALYGKVKLRSAVAKRVLSHYDEAREWPLLCTIREWEQKYACKWTAE